MIVNDPASGNGIAPENDAGSTAQYYKRDFWSKENLKFSQPHYRLEKSARIINRLARGRECTLLDVGCGPATLMGLISPNIQYHGIDIAIHDPAPNLIEADFLETPIRFGDKRFDIIVAQGVFEYTADLQSQKFAEIARLLNGNGTFIASYWNFDHRSKQISRPFSNVRSVDDFREGLADYFNIDRFSPVSHNWHHSSPNRKLIKAVNRHMDRNIPFISSILAVEYFFICSSRGPRGPEGLALTD
jgi:SAM-dependent methyltransferase